MKSSNSIGSLMHLLINEIDPGDRTNIHEFLLKATANILKKKGGQNWIPVMLKTLVKTDIKLLVITLFML